MSTSIGDLAARITVAAGHASEATDFYLNSGQLTPGTMPVFHIVGTDNSFDRALMAEIAYKLGPDSDWSRSRALITYKNIHIMRGGPRLANVLGSTAFGYLLTTPDPDPEIVRALQNGLVTFKMLGHQCLELFL